MSESKQQKLQNKIQKLVILSVLVAIVFILQYFGLVISIPGTGLSVTLTLVPIVLGAVLYGPLFGAILGSVFGGVVAFQVFQGLAGAFSAAMYMKFPILTLFLCVFKGFACGFVPGLISRVFAKKNLYLSVILSAIAAPIVNTGIFVFGLVVFYRDIAAQYAGDASLLAFIIIGIVGINFIIEFFVNLIAAPVLVRVIRALEKTIGFRLNTDIV